VAFNGGAMCDWKNRCLLKWRGVHVFDAISINPAFDLMQATSSGCLKTKKALRTKQATTRMNV